MSKQEYLEDKYQKAIQGSWNPWNGVNMRDYFLSKKVFDAKEAKIVPNYPDIFTQNFQPPVYLNPEVHHKVNTHQMLSLQENEHFNKYGKEMQQIRAAAILGKKVFEQTYGSKVMNEIKSRLTEANVSDRLQGLNACQRLEELYGSPPPAVMNGITTQMNQLPVAKSVKDAIVLIANFRTLDEELSAFPNHAMDTQHQKITRLVGRLKI